MNPTRYSETVGDDDAFAFLIMAAREDVGFRDQVMAILSLASFHRKSLLNTFLYELRMKGAPKGLLRSVGYLLDDAVADRALATLREELQ